MIAGCRDAGFFGKTLLVFVPVTTHMNTTLDNNEASNATAAATPEKTKGFLTALFTGWGVPGSLARILAGAVLGALSALWALSQSGCTAEWSQSPDGSSSWYGKVEFPQPACITTADK